MQIEDKRKAKATLQAMCNSYAERNSSIHFCKLLGQCPTSERQIPDLAKFIVSSNRYVIKKRYIISLTQYIVWTQTKFLFASSIMDCLITQLYCINHTIKLFYTSRVRFQQYNKLSLKDVVQQ